MSNYEVKLIPGFEDPSAVVAAAVLLKSQIEGLDTGGMLLQIGDPMARLHGLYEAGTSDIRGAGLTLYVPLEPRIGIIAALAANSRRQALRRQLLLAIEEDAVEQGAIGMLIGAKDERDYYFLHSQGYDPASEVDFLAPGMDSLTPRQQELSLFKPLEDLNSLQ